MVKSIKWSPPGLWKFFLALSAWIALSLGRKKMALFADSMAAIVTIYHGQFRGKSKGNIEGMRWNQCLKDEDFGGRIRVVLIGDPSLTSSLHPYISLTIIILDSIGSTGNSAILRPSFVNSPLSLRAPKAYSCSKARISVSAGGGSIKSKLIKSSIPRD